MVPAPHSFRKYWLSPPAHPHPKVLSRSGEGEGEGRKGEREGRKGERERRREGGKEGEKEKRKKRKTVRAICFYQRAVRKSFLSYEYAPKACELIPWGKCLWPLPSMMT